MIAFARNSRGACKALGDGNHVFRRDWLNDGQRRAVEHVLESTDSGDFDQGRRRHRQDDHDVRSHGSNEAQESESSRFAPSADASRGVLRKEGFSDAEPLRCC